MLYGSAKVRMDEKGRLAMPSRFRDALADSEGLVLTLHPHKHLSLYQHEQFERIKETMLAKSNIGYMEAHLQEVVLGCADYVGMDGTGRIMVPTHLRSLAGIKREVLLFSVGESIHIWDEQAWEQRQAVVLSRLQDSELSEEWKDLKL